MARKTTKRKSSKRKKTTKRATKKKTSAAAKPKRAKTTRRRKKAPAKPKTGALENRVDALLRTHGLSLEEAPEDLIAKADRRASRFVPGKPGRRRAKKRS